jgi:uncharacterized membrane protein
MGAVFLDLLTGEYGMEPVEKQPAAPKEKTPAEDRLIMLCDGVFAIAMTLLVLDIKLSPHLITELDFGKILADLSQKILSYLIAFFVLASYWLGHRHIMQDLRRMDNVVIWLTFLFLAFVAFFPVVSPVLWGNPGPASVIFYTLVLSGCGFPLLLIRLYSSWNHRLIDADVSQETILYQVTLAFIGPAVFCLSLLLLLLPFFKSNPTDISFPWLLIAVLPGIVRRRQARRQKQRAARREQEPEPAPQSAHTTR